MSSLLEAVNNIEKHNMLTTNAIVNLVRHNLKAKTKVTAHRMLVAEKHAIALYETGKATSFFAFTHAVECALLDAGYGENAKRHTNYLIKLIANEPERFKDLLNESPSLGSGSVRYLRQAI